jgi:hypothetical protein
VKATFLLSLVALSVASGCSDGSSNTPANTSSLTNASSSEGSVLTAPVDYLGAAAKAQQNAVKTVDVAAVTQAVRLFQTELGRLPKDLDELVQEKYLPRIPATPYGTKLSYDPTTGEVKVVKQ